MNKQTCIEIINKANGISDANELHYAIIFNRCPISNQVEHRLVYSDSYLEVLQWLEEVTKVAKQYSKPYVTWLDGQMKDSSSAALF